MPQFKKNSILFSETDYFSKIVLDYLNEDNNVQDLYDYSPNIMGIEACIKNRRLQKFDRKNLVKVLKEQYKSIDTSAAVSDNINALLNEHTFTITTAHQPNIFTGPIYFFYKILHTIHLAKYLKTIYKNENFVPVYYMGSEDADLDELGNVHIASEKIKWKTKQTGAVGKMLVDNEFIQVLEKIAGTIGITENGRNLITLFKNAYTLNTPIQVATLQLLNTLLGKYGLIVLIPDNKQLKKQFIPIVLKELATNFSYHALQKTVPIYSKNYPLQTEGRLINLFYLKDNIRERIIWDGKRFNIVNTPIYFTTEEMDLEVHTYPERFSPNVILRGLFQEMILPNIVYIGGGGEIAYWLELKEVFKDANVTLPVLMLRNSCLFINKKNNLKIKNLKFNFPEIFLQTELLIHHYIQSLKILNLNLREIIRIIELKAHLLKERVSDIDKNLFVHIDSLKKLEMNKLISLHKKMIRAIKRKEDDKINKIRSIKNELFPSKNLQERIINFSELYTICGDDFFEILLRNMTSIQSEFIILTEK